MVSLSRRRLFGLAASTALATTLPAHSRDHAAHLQAHVEDLRMMFANTYTRQLALALSERETVAARVMDRAFNEIWFAYPDRQAVFHWLDHGAVTEEPVEYECVGHGEYQPRRQQEHA